MQGESQKTLAQPSRSTRNATWLAWSIWTLSMVLAGLGLIFLVLSYSTTVPLRWGPRGFPAISAFTASTVGALIVSNRPRHPIGWIFAWLGLLSGAQALVEEYRVYSLLTMGGSLPGGEIAAWVSNWIWVPAIAPYTTFLFLLFPTGRLLSPAWRPVAWLAALSATAVTLTLAFTPGPFEQFAFLRNPFGIEALGGLRPFANFILLPFTAALFASVGSLILRLRSSSGEERQQLKWFVYAAALVALTAPAGAFYLTFQAGPLLFISAMAGSQVAVGVAILKYRLYDIDLIINRTLVYGPLTAILSGVYVASIGLFQRLFVAVTGEESDAAIVLTTLVVAAAFTPVRSSLQATVDKRFKEIPDPTKELKAFGERVKSIIQVLDVKESTKELLNEAVRAFQAEGGAVYLSKDGKMELSHTIGKWNGESKINAPLESDGARYGLVALSVRKNGREYTSQDLETLQHIVNLVAQAIRLAGR